MQDPNPASVSHYWKFVCCVGLAFPCLLLPIDHHAQGNPPPDAITGLPSSALSGKAAVPADGSPLHPQRSEERLSRAHATAAYTEGMRLLGLELPEQALLYFQKALSHEQGYTATVPQFALTLLKLDRKEQATAFLLKQIEIHPAEPKLHSPAGLLPHGSKKQNQNPTGSHPRPHRSSTRPHPDR
ncbi:MAG: tetratricopeptide repeat protein [Blastochloris sp.]|nr:tetratricopeptide repeat protein [Blastochloris sp.]